MTTHRFTQRATRRAALTVALGVAASLAHANTSGTGQHTDYPSKTIRIIVPYTAGAFNDALARSIGARLQASMKQTVIIENRSGAGTVIGTNAVAKAQPDGYTLLQVPVAFAINATLMPKLPYDSIKDFEFITLVATSPFVLITNNNFPAKSVPELVAMAKEKPGVYAYSSSGNGGNAHLMGEMLKNMAKIDVIHVPYKGAAPSMNDLAAGQVQFTFATYAGASAGIKSGRVRPIAVTSKERWTKFPHLPTIAEAGYPDYNAVGWWGFAAPAGTPPEIVQKLNREINQAMTSPEVRQYLVPEGVEPMGTTPEQFKKLVVDEIATWAKVIKDAGVRAE